MQYVSVAENCCFMYSPDLELLFAASSILQGETVHQLCTEIYGEKRIAELKGKYPFLSEVFRSHMGEASMGILEPLLDVSLGDFSLEGYKSFLLRMEPAAFLRRYYCMDIPEADISAALADDGKLEKLFSEQRLSDSLIGLQSFFRNTERFINEYFALAEALRTPEFETAIAVHADGVAAALADAQESLKGTAPLAYSERLMGKTFYNRGPYGWFVFSVSLLMPFRSVRFFGKGQILFTSLREQTLGDDEVIAQLRVIADPTRFKMIALIGEKQTMRGLEIAKALHIAPSTVSHHIEQLSKAGIVHEEPSKNSKYYSINKTAVNAILKRLSETLGK